MNEKAKPASPERRDFLKLAALGATTGGVALATQAATVEAAVPVAGKSAGYRETAHVKTYYELARF
ncbi:ubiquinol-cytochrome c reductase iron-sulfur subunit N-terminal domain-containing protein [Oceanibacterium hippocampi]|uniref:Uncharacterized protein n=1 Tax=Oceanibacterium hippocampi TaxID=745714 RepID=A0A1Y5TCA9_9PROT|nr:ubiquinol-cytochrome c reductase iron-sulfur subunit N-terminal domain-containing protein [Oceanibacterium hippocampi]SLN60466.1 hypothetical protein OCH7691_02661 [Oceanibacterium hippocampi]